MEIVQFHVTSRPGTTMQLFSRIVVDLMVLKVMAHTTNTITFNLVYNCAMGVLESHMIIDYVLKSQKCQIFPYWTFVIPQYRI